MCRPPLNKTWKSLTWTEYIGPVWWPLKSNIYVILPFPFTLFQFVAQPNCQQLLASRWYDQFPGWRRRHWASKLFTCFIIGLLFPLFSIFYLFSPKSRYGLFIRRPFIKFICHTASYMTFLFLLLLASQHISSPQSDFQGPAPTTVEWMILPWVLGNTHTHTENWNSSFLHLFRSSLDQTSVKLAKGYFKFG